MVETNHQAIAIDTQEDLDRARLELRLPKEWKEELYSIHPFFNDKEDIFIPIV
jgi:hypothetical protein